MRKILRVYLKLGEEGERSCFHRIINFVIVHIVKQVSNVEIGRSTRIA